MDNSNIKIVNVGKTTPVFEGQDCNQEASSCLFRRLFPQSFLYFCGRINPDGKITSQGTEYTLWCGKEGQI